MMAHVLWFEQIRLDDLPKVGGKNASLGEMYQALTGKGVKIPNGFAVTADAYWHFIDSNNLRPRMRDLLARVNAGSNLQTLQQIGEGLRELLLSASLPDDLSSAITNAYAELGSCGLCTSARPPAQACHCRAYKRLRRQARVLCGQAVTRHFHHWSGLLSQ
jgi:pyruvate,water dikinase